MTSPPTRNDKSLSAIFLRLAHDPNHIDSKGFLLYNTVPPSQLLELRSNHCFTNSNSNTNIVVSLIQKFNVTVIGLTSLVAASCVNQL